MLTAGVYSLVGFEVTPSTVIGFLTILGFALYDVVVVFDKVQENTRGITGSSTQTYAEAANLAVNQTLMRSINTGLVALLPVGGLLFIGAGLLGAGTLKDLGLVLFVGMGAGVLLVDLLRHAGAGRRSRSGAAVSRRTPSGCWPGAPAAGPRRGRPAASARPAPAGKAGRGDEAGRRRSTPALAGAAPTTGARPDRQAPATRGARRSRRGGSRPSGGASAAEPARAARPGVAAGSQRPSVAARVTDGVTETASAYGVTAARDRRALVASRVVDVPDFPKPGIVFKDLMPLFADGPAFRAGDRRRSSRTTARTRSTWWPASRRAGSCSPPRSRTRPAPAWCRSARRASCPGRRYSASYALEYGEATLEVHADAFAAGQRVLVVDDVLATGGTAEATLGLVERAGGVVAGFRCCWSWASWAAGSGSAPRPVHALLTV